MSQIVDESANRSSDSLFAAVSGLRLFFESFAMLRHELFVPILRRFLGSRYYRLAVYFLLGIVAFAALSNLLIAKFVVGPRGTGGAGLILLQFAHIVLQPATMLILVLGLLLRGFLASPFVRGDLMMTRITPAEFLRLLLAMLIAVLGGLFCIQWVGAIVLRTFQPNTGAPLRLIDLLFPWGINPYGAQVPIGATILHGAERCLHSWISLLWRGILGCFLICRARQLAAGIVATWLVLTFAAVPGGFLWLFGYQMQMLCLQWFNNHAAAILVADLIYDVPIMIVGALLLGVVLQYVRVRVFPQLIQRIRAENA